MCDNRKEEVIIVSVNYLLRNKKVNDSKVKEAFDFAMKNFPTLQVNFDKVKKEILRRYNYQRSYYDELDLLDNLDR